MRYIFLLSLILLNFNLSLAQNSVGIGTNNPNPNALLELDNAGNPLGLLLPRQDISTFTLTAADNGMMVFNPGDSKVYIWDGATLSWVSNTSEWGVSGVNIFNLNGGNVGIGTNTPQAKLSVNATGFPSMQIQSSSTLGTWTSINNTSAGGQWFHMINTGSGNAEGPGKLIFFSGSSFNAVSSMLLSMDHATGNVGIGTSAPTSSLHVNGTGLITGRLELTAGTDASGTANTGVLEIANSLRLDGNEIITNTNTSLSLQNDNNGDLIVDANTFFVDASANRVGILNNAPDATLEISGDVLANNGVFSVNTINQDISTSLNVDHIWHDDGPNVWHMVSDNAYKSTGNTTLSIGRLLVNNDATSNCITGGSPFFFESCNDISSELEFNFSGNFSGTQATAMPDLDILAVSDGFGIVGSFNNAGRFDFRQNNSNMFSISSSSIYPGTDNLASCGTSSSRWTIVYAANGTINTSDKRLKENIQNLNYGLGTLMKMKPVTFDWKDKPSGKKIGFIAQDLQEIIPEVVSVGDDENKTMGVYYSDLIPVLVKAIQEQQSEIESLKNKMNDMQASIRK